MSNIIYIPVSPVGKPRMTRADAWRKRPVVERYWAYKDALKEVVKGILEPTFMVTFYVPMPKSWPIKKRAAMNGTPHQVKSDVDNFLKAFMDCLCDNDSYIYDVRARKFWAEIGHIELIESPIYTIS